MNARIDHLTGGICGISSQAAQPPLCVTSDPSNPCPCDIMSQSRSHPGGLDLAEPPSAERLGNDPSAVA